MTEKEMLDLASKFSPYRCVSASASIPASPLLSCNLTHTHIPLKYKTSHANAQLKCLRSLFMWYMWRIEDVDVSVLQQ